MPREERSGLAEDLLVERLPQVPHEREADGVEPVLGDEGAEVLEDERGEEEKGQDEGTRPLRDAERHLEGGEPAVERLRDRRPPHDGLLADHGSESGRGAGLGHHGGPRFGRQDLIEERAEQVRHDGP